MRHRVYGKHLGRNRNERKNLFRGLIHSLLLHGTISITSARAKAVKGLVDKIINLAKNNRLDILESTVTNKILRDRLIKEIVPKLGNRTSGFTSIVRLGPRQGDQTTMVRMSLIGSEKLEPVKKVSRVKGQVSREEKSKTVDSQALKGKTASRVIAPTKGKTEAVKSKKVRTKKSKTK